MRLKVLGLGPVDDRLGRVSLIDMEAGNFLDPLAGKHNELDGSRVRRMNRSVWTAIGKAVRIRPHSTSEYLAPSVQWECQKPD